jgi:hypothetical protein
MTGFSDDKHPGPDALAAYLDRRLDDAARAEVEAHVAWCDECRIELREVSAILRSGGVKQRRSRAWIGPAVAAAAAIVLLVAYPRGPSSENAAPAHRDAPGIVDTSPVLTSPAPGAEGPEARVLRWSRVDRADRYRVTVFDPAGNVAWRTETQDTAVSLPDKANLVAGVSYMWRVDARVGVDRWVESKLESLSP